MKRTINCLGWLGVSLTILTLVLTLLTTYQFIYVKYFNSYYTLQWCMFFTMIFLAIRMLEFKANYKNILYSITCTVIAAGTIFFMFMKVF